MDGPVEDSFDRAFDDLFVRAKRVALRIVGDSMAAEDVAAEALARALLRWRKLASTPHRDAWVLRVASNLAIDSARRRPRGVEAPSSVDPTSHTLLRIQLVDVLRGLPKRQREAVTLRYICDLGESEVAAVMNVTIGTIKALTHHGLRSLRQELGDEFKVFEDERHG